MLIGYARVSKHDGTQVTDLQIDALIRAGVDRNNIYEEKISGAKDKPELAACLRSLREGDILVVWKLDRLGRRTLGLLQLVDDLTKKGVGLRVLSAFGNDTLDTTSPMGKMFLVVSAMFAEMERDLLIERTHAGLASARARGRIGGRKPKLTKQNLIYAQHVMKNREITVKELARQLGVSTKTIYLYLSPDGEFTKKAIDFLENKK